MTFTNKLTNINTSLENLSSVIYDLLMSLSVMKLPMNLQMAKACQKNIHFNPSVFPSVI
jgi:hypothetical protein